MTAEPIRENDMGQFMGQGCVGPVAGIRPEVDSAQDRPPLIEIHHRGSDGSVTGPSQDTVVCLAIGMNDHLAFRLPAICGGFHTPRRPQANPPRFTTESQPASLRFVQLAATAEIRRLNKCPTIFLLNRRDNLRFGRVRDVGGFIGNENVNTGEQGQ